MAKIKREFNLVNADTDSIAFCKKNGEGFSETEQISLLKELNDLFPEGIKFEHDGIYDSVIVVKAKNYLLKTGDKIKIKGSALKATMKETALRDFLEDSLKLMLDKDIDGVVELYMDGVDRIKYLKDIGPWCSKKTITESVLKKTTTAQERILAAIKGKSVQEGDKIRVFFKSEEEVCLEENFDGTYDADRLYDKLYNTVKVFELILEAEFGFKDKVVKKTGEVKKIPIWKEYFPNFKLKGNKSKLEEL